MLEQEGFGETLLEVIREAEKTELKSPQLRALAALFRNVGGAGGGEDGDDGVEG